MINIPVDAGMIGIVPVAGIRRDDGSRDGGTEVVVEAGRYLNLHYHDGRITISADLNGAIPVLEDTRFWVGDLSYVLENNIPGERPKWWQAEDPDPGYWAACVASMATPQYGTYFAKPVPLGDGMAGLVSRTMWGDGLYPARVETDGEFMVRFVVETGDLEDEEEEE